MKIDRVEFFKRFKDHFRDIRSQETVDNLNSLLDVLEKYYALHDARDAKVKMAYLLATVYHEVGVTFTPQKIENLNYTTAKRIIQVWPARFKTTAEAIPYTNNPEKLAEAAYGRRMGNTLVGHGWKYRGRGWVQITGKANYEKFAKMIGQDIVEDPDLVLTVPIAGRILVEGAERGLFTGKKMNDYISASGMNYYYARAIINSDVSANGADIKDKAIKFEYILNKSLTF